MVAAAPGDGGLGGGGAASSDDQGKGGAAALPLEGTVVQRLQRFATYGKLRQLALGKIALSLVNREAAEAAGSGAAPSTTAPVEAEVDVPDDPSAAAHAEAAVAAAALGRLCPEIAGEAAAMYQRLDADGSGAVSLAELRVGLAREGYATSVDEVRQLLSRVDLDRDGEIQASEWLCGLLDWDAVARRDRSRWEALLDGAWAELDLDGDGVLDLGEVVGLLSDRRPERPPAATGPDAPGWSGDEAWSAPRQGEGREGAGMDECGGLLLEARAVLREAREARRGGPSPGSDGRDVEPATTDAPITRGDFDRLLSPAGLSASHSPPRDTAASAPGAPSPTPGTRSGAGTNAGAGAAAASGGALGALSTAAKGVFGDWDARWGRAATTEAATDGLSSGPGDRSPDPLAQYPSRVVGAGGARPPTPGPLRGVAASLGASGSGGELG